MMRRICVLVAAFLAILTGLVVLPASSAVASAVPPSSAGQRWALKVAGYYVTVDASATGDMKLRAKATTPGGWETFTLHTDYIPGAGYGTTISLRSEATGRYVTAEDEASGSLLRTRGTNTGAWERFKLVPLGNDQFGLRADNGKYVAAELGTYPDHGLLRARTSDSADPPTLGSWERFTLEEVGGQGSTQSPPQAAAAPSGRHDIVSWNICSNNNPNCPLKFATPATVGDRVARGIKSALDSRRPEAIFFQEICEKSAKPLELALEQATSSVGGDWDVRFMPTYYPVASRSDHKPPIRAQKNCSDGTDGADRGAYGIALAVPDTNVWYQGYVLPSPPDKEQRPALCAVIPQTGSAYCNAHFSSPGDDTGTAHPYRPEQADELRQKADILSAYGYGTFYGGDLNTTTTDVAYLDRLYDARQECGQATPDASHTGTGTYGDNKIDYIFGPQGPSYGCSVVDPALSDHKLLHATVTYGS